MNDEKQKASLTLKWYFIIGFSAVGVLLLAAILAEKFLPSYLVSVPQYVWFIGALIVLAAILIILIEIIRLCIQIEENGLRLERLQDVVEKNSEILSQIRLNTGLSETAKAIASREVDRQSISQAVFDKLQKQDFNAADQIVEEISRSTAYQELAEQLRTEIGNYRNATEQERINQVIKHIEELLENYQWAKASIQIESLIAAAPNCEKAKAMRQKLVDKKEERKKILLNLWDDAIKREATDRSIEILKELDMYLTPNEGLALQEAAKDVFRNKLHNLGVQFSLAVSGKQWVKAIDTGRQIIKDFPNTRMAQEIREKMNILVQNVQQQNLVSK
jgi:hypothetical protein